MTASENISFRERYQIEFDSLIKYINNYDFSNFLKEEIVIDSLKKYHRKLRALNLFSHELKNEYNHFYLEECVSDLIGTIPLLVQGYYKQVNFSIRSSIENFFKFLYSNFINKNDNSVELKVSKLLEDVLNHFKKQKDIKLELDKLTRLYSDFCNFVHTNSQIYASLVKYLVNYPVLSAENLSQTTNNAVETIKSIIIILLNTYDKLFANISIIRRQEILESFNHKFKQKYLYSD
jgi:hypothetical protein